MSEKARSAEHYMISKNQSFRSYINIESAIAAVMLACIAGYTILRTTSSAPEMLFILILCTILGSLPFVYHMVKSMLARRFGVDLLAIAAIAASLSIHEFAAAAVILFMLSGGESLERFAENQARSSLERLLRQAPSIAHLLSGDDIIDTPVDRIVQGDILIVKQHEAFPIDGIVEEGSSSIDESAITGEPVPRDVVDGDAVWSGTINTGLPLRIRATSTFETSLFSGIIRLVKQAEEEKAPFVRLADRYSVVFTAISFSIAGAAALIRPELGAAVLVVATPCPLILATPIAFISGMSRSAKKGIVVKHGGVFESLLNARVFLFDKTGTLTFGVPTVKEAETCSAEHSPEDILRIAASLERLSTHMLAQGIVEHAAGLGLSLLPTQDAQETIGQGIVGTINGVSYAIGKERFVISQRAMKEHQAERTGTSVYVAKEGKLIGIVHFTDKIRKSAPAVLQKIHEMRPMADLVLVTGDTEIRAEEAGKKLGFTKIRAHALPAEKVSLIKEYEEAGTHTVMIGDGINDAPALASASVGIALGFRGATASTDTADAVITVDDIGKVADLIAISKKTMRTAKESIYAGIGLSVIAMFFAAAGYLPPLWGAFLQEGIDIVVILNALRALK